ncbi:MAG: glycoside hydrolase family 3 C-terminal domain-containing protein, partial [Bacteroidetes bacterium]|nr:glycoside hydrolase family 3 C-terminal domain-containing protein [Bacteroidota bacterium]
DQFLDGRSWGTESLSEVERHYKVLMAGVDQFGGNNDAKPILEAYQMGVKEHGEAKMRARIELSAVRLLKNIFNVGVFENPYLNEAESKAIVGKPDFMKAGYEAQLKSVVLLKNHAQTLPIKSRKTVFVPKRFIPATRNFLGVETPATTDYPVSLDLVKKYFNVTENAEEADFALVFIQNPTATIGYDKEDLKNGGNGYIPISLQYGDYIATEAREKSIAGGDPLEKSADRSYKNKAAKTPNQSDAQLVAETKVKMKNKPVVVSVFTSNPMVFSEIEKEASAIVLNFGVQDQALLDIISGKFEPSALLPMQMPIDMKTVEKQAEDVPFDMIPYRDSDGNLYDFSFGMNWKGVINDARVKRFKK